MIRLSTLRSCAARARFDEDGAIGGIELYQSGAPAATCWQAGLAEEFLPWLALARFGDFNFARLRSQLARSAPGQMLPFATVPFGSRSYRVSFQRQQAAASRSSCTGPHP